MTEVEFNKKITKLRAMKTDVIKHTKMYYVTPELKKAVQHFTKQIPAKNADIVWVAGSSFDVRFVELSNEYDYLLGMASEVKAAYHKADRERISREADEMMRANLRAVEVVDSAGEEDDESLITAIDAGGYNKFQTLEEKVIEIKEDKKQKNMIKKKETKIKEGQITLSLRGGAREGAGRPSLGVKKAVSITLPQEEWDEIDYLIQVKNEFKSYADYFRYLLNLRGG